MASDKTPRCRVFGISTSSPTIISHRQHERLVGALADMDSESTAAGERSDLDTPSAFHSFGRRDNGYVPPRYRTLPERYTDAELDSAINDIELTMVAWLDGEADERGNALDESASWFGPEREHGFKLQLRLAENPVKEVKLDAWDFDPRVFELVGCIESQPVLRRRDLPQPRPRRNRPQPVAPRQRRELTGRPGPQPASITATPQPLRPNRPPVPEAEMPCPLDWSGIQVLTPSR